MTILTISNDNYITVLDSLADAESNPGAEHFSSAEELTQLASNWPTVRLVEIWNNLPGVTPVKKFTDRNTGVTRIWKALQELECAAVSTKSEAAEAPADPASEPLSDVAQGPGPMPINAEDAAPATPSPEPEGATQEPTEEANVAPPANDVATPEPSPSEEPTPAKRARNAAPREGSKTTIILDLLKRESGASLQELMEATGWQKHSVRGFLAGTVGKKMGLELISKKGEDGVRIYSVQA